MDMDMDFCRVFSHSPVYRVGGDEFVAIGNELVLVNFSECEYRCKTRRRMAQ